MTCFRSTCWRQPAQSRSSIAISESSEDSAAVREGAGRVHRSLQPSPAAQGLDQRVPCPPADTIVTLGGPVERRDRLGALLHEYTRTAQYLKQALRWLMML